MFNEGLFISGAIAIVLAGLFIYIRVTKDKIYGVIAKTVASLAFIGMGIGAFYALPMPRSLIFIILGAVFGLVGDILLDLKRAQSEFNDIYLLSGMGSFALGHLSYFAGVLLFALDDFIFVPIPILVAVGGGIVISALSVGLAKPLGLKYGKFTIPSAVYAFLLGFMVVFTLMLGIQTDAYYYVAFVGMLLFLASDLILSKQYFGGEVNGQPLAENKLLTIINHALYYLAQIVIMAWLWII